MSLIDASENALREPTQGRINQAANQDLNGLLQREGVSRGEAKKLRRKLREGTSTEQAQAVSRIDSLLAKFPSPRQATRAQVRSERRMAVRDRMAWW